MCHLLLSVPAPRTDRLRGACVVRPTDCKLAAGELTSRIGLLLTVAHLYHHQSVVNLHGCDAMRQTGNFPMVCSRSALSGQGFALCDVVA
jgi:hypothetical protein